MFIGHWAPALVIAAKPRAPGIAVLFIAAQLVDWAFFALLLGGIEHMRFSPGFSVMNPMDLYHMPYTHSLLGSGLFAAVFGGLIWFASKDRMAALLGGGAVLSHWLLDLLVHVPDLTLAGNPPKLGFGLWNHPWIEIPLELGITFGALWFYARARRPARMSLLVLGGVLALLQAINWFGPVEADVSTGTTFLAFFAFSIATAAAWWMGKSTANPA